MDSFFRKYVGTEEKKIFQYAVIITVLNIEKKDFMIKFLLKHLTKIVVFAILAWNFILLGLIYSMWTSELREYVKQDAFATDLAEANRVVMTVVLGVLWFWSMFHILNAVQLAILIKKNLKNDLGS